MSDLFQACAYSLKNYDVKVELFDIRSKADLKKARTRAKFDILLTADYSQWKDSMKSVYTKNGYGVSENYMIEEVHFGTRREVVEKYGGIKKYFAKTRFNSS